MKKNKARTYWDSLADAYQSGTVISCADFHYGPLLPGDRELRLLPPALTNLRCLELGCGAAQNSVYLATRNAQCTALDHSAAQLRHARRLSLARGVRVDLVLGDLGRLPFRAPACFDLVHSTYALPFVADQRRAIAAAAAMVRPGGLLLLTTAHPLGLGQWAYDEGGAAGLFIEDYFSPPEDARSLPEGGRSVCRPVPISRLFQWLVDSGMIVRRMLEPQPVPVDHLTDAELKRRVPYFSEAWYERAAEMARIPFVVIMLAEKPLNAGRQQSAIRAGCGHG